MHEMHRRGEEKRGANLGRNVLRRGLFRVGSRSEAFDAPQPDCSLLSRSVLQILWVIN